MATATFVTTSGFPVDSQDSDGNWTTTVTFSDATSVTYYFGQNIPDWRYVVTQASISLGENQNQAAIAAIVASTFE